MFHGFTDPWILWILWTVTTRRAADHWSQRKARALTGAVWVFVDPLSWDLSSQADLSFQQNSALNLGWFQQQGQLLGRLMGRLIELKLLRRVRTPDKYSITSRVPDKNLVFF